MTFRDFATDEAASLVRRLLDQRAQQSARTLEAFQQALNAATQVLESSVSTDAGSDRDAELAGLIDRLTTAADADRQAAAQEASNQAHVAIEAVRTELTAALTAAQADAESIREELQRATSRIAALDAERAKAEDAVARAEAARSDAEKAQQNETIARTRVEYELQTIQDLLTTTRAQAAAIAKQLDVEAAERARLAVDLGAAESLLQALEEQKQTMAGEAQVSSARLVWLEGAYAEADVQLREARAQLDAATQSASTAERTREQTSADTKTWRAEQAASVRQHAVTFLSRSLDRLRACNDALADASTYDEVLAALVTVFATEFQRVALFGVKYNRLEGIRQVGFEAQPDMSQLLIPRTLDSLLTRAAMSGHIETLAGGELDDAAGSPFGGTPGSVWAIPIEVDGAPVAVIYADDSDRAHTELGGMELRTKFADLLACSAASALARLPNPAQGSPDLREYASQLVSELESMYGADVSMGRKKEELRSRLRDNLEFARRMFAERISPDNAPGAALFEEQLAAATKAGTDFAKELGKLLKARENSTAADTPKRRAEAR
jgi:chemotaxis protein histidine kinase CheA